MRLGLSVAVLLGLAGLQARAQEMKTEEQKTIYALGLAMSRPLKVYDLSPEELELVKKGLVDGLMERPAVELDTYGPQFQPLANKRKELYHKNLLVKVAQEPGAVRLPSGVVYKEISAGSGGRPRASDTVKVHYRGTLTNGTEFDSSHKRGQPASFPLNGVIRCWTEGLQRMKVGGKAQLVCPSDTAYGEKGSPPSIPPNATLVFEVELLGIESK
jgi:FKBP-type peptidyl-prolyl cis-trans isomerase FkpA